MTSRPYDNHVYMTQPLAGGPERAVHRKDIMPATTPFVVDADQQSPPPRPDVNDSESDNGDELCILPQQNPAPAAAVPVMLPVVSSLIDSAACLLPLHTIPQSYNTCCNTGFIMPGLLQKVSEIR